LTGEHYTARPQARRLPDGILRAESTGLSAAGGSNRFLVKRGHFAEWAPNLDSAVRTYRKMTEGRPRP
jgi:hypothetical protein